MPFCSVQSQNRRESQSPCPGSQTEGDAGGQPATRAIAKLDRARDAGDVSLVVCVCCPREFTLRFLMDTCLGTQVIQADRLACIGTRLGMSGHLVIQLLVIIRMPRFNLVCLFFLILLGVTMGLVYGGEGSFLGGGSDCGVGNSTVANAEGCDYPELMLLSAMMFPFGVLPLVLTLNWPLCKAAVGSFNAL